jgi:hypothetical protein
MKSIDKSRLFKRAWFLVNKNSYSLSYALKLVWSELKQAVKDAAVKIENANKQIELEKWWSTDEYKALQNKNNSEFKEMYLEMSE